MTHDDLSSHSSHLLPTNRYSVQSNLIIETEDSIPELQLFRKAGGQTVVDVSSIGIRRKIEYVPKIARESGVNIITGTGYYVDFTVPEEAKMMTVQEIHTIIKERKTKKEQKVQMLLQKRTDTSAVGISNLR